MHHDTYAGLSTTLLAYAEDRLRALSAACAFSSAETAAAVDVLRVLAESWGSRTLDDTPRWSGVTDDCTPLEFSLGLTPHAAPELRFVVEAQRDPATPQTYWRAAEELNARLESEFGACLTRLHSIADLVRPPGDAYFAMIHGAVLRPGRQPLFKVYLNPKAHGPQHSWAVTAEVFERLGLRVAWKTIAPAVRRDDELQFIALDLSAEPDARVKLYVRHRHGARADFERAASVASNAIVRDLDAFIGELFPDGMSSRARPATTMYAVTSQSSRIDAAFSLATYPYIGSDAQALERIGNLLHRFGLPAAAYRRSVQALATRALDGQSGLHNYVSFQNRGGERRVTVYLTPRMYLDRLGPIGFDPVTVWPTPSGNLYELPAHRHAALETA